MLGFSFFKKKRKSPPANVSFATCSKLVSIAQELENLLRVDIPHLLNKYYTDIQENTFSERRSGDKKVFEAATMGVAIIHLVEHCEKESLSADLVTTVVGHLKQVFVDPEHACVYNHTMKFVYDYKHFIEDEIATKLQTKEILLATFTGAWITRYYLGDQRTIINTSAAEIGKVIQDHLGDIWGLSINEG